MTYVENIIFSPSQEVLHRILTVWGSEVRLVPCSPQQEEDCLVAVEEQEQLPCLAPLLAVLVSSHHLVLLSPLPPGSLADLLTFSPAALLSATRLHFIVYQLLELFQRFHSLGLTVGPVSLHQVLLQPSLLLQLQPCLSSLLPTPSAPQEDPAEQTCQVEAAALSSRLQLVLHHQGEEMLSTSLPRATSLWSSGHLSNLDYILFLNYLTGRRFGQPNHHPVVPWVTDFSSPSSLRDLNRSKFRLTKGDEALDRTYESGQHHVTDVLSEITYYTYLSRVTKREVLQRTVRSSWVPHEYPASLARLYTWSPDEAIPELYTDPAVFRSLHPDLPDLVLPPWTDSPEQFVSWHRSVLESEPVSRALHTWLDLTFGYKLSGAASVRSKNVCLNLMDGHTEPRSAGAVQLFTAPHPPRSSRPLITPPPFPTITKEENLEDDEDSTAYLNGKISLPSGCNPLHELTELEALAYFSTKQTSEHQEGLTTPPPSAPRDPGPDTQVLGCLVWELLGRRSPAPGQFSSLEDRHSLAVAGLQAEGRSLAPVMRSLLETLLLPQDHLPVLTLVHPVLSLIPSPPFFLLLHSVLSGISSLEHSLLACLSSPRPEAEAAVAEAQVRLVAQHLGPHMPALDREEVGLVLPLVTSLLTTTSTSILAAWSLFDLLSSVLGPDDTATHLLGPVTALYKGSATTKHLKLFHRSFLISLVVRFRLGPFLKHFTNLLIEAVGGYNDLELAIETKREALDSTVEDNCEINEPEDTDRKECDNFSEGEVFSFEDEDIPSKDSLDEVEVGQSVAQRLVHRREEEAGWLDLEKYTKVGENWGGQSARQESSITCVATDSVAWLACRLGPVLAARHLAGNLLRMLSLCYQGEAGALRHLQEPLPEQRVRVSHGAVLGDRVAEPVLQLLAQVASLYGEGLVLGQYLPYCCDLASQAKQRVSASLAGGLLGCCATVHRVLPLLTDTALVHELPNLLAHLLLPLLQVATSRRAVFSGGPEPRSLLLYRLLDVTYLLGLRVGEDLARVHLTPVATGLFGSFDKVYSEPQEQQEPAMVSLTQVLTPSLAYSAYVAFYLLLGGAFLDRHIPTLTLVRGLCERHQHSLAGPVHRPVSGLELAGRPASPLLHSSGNMIVVGEMGEGEESRDRELILRPVGDSTRQLRGSWLAYWEHEVGRDTRDQGFNLKQIKLLTFTGHTASVKSLAVLNNENSFVSGSKDKTVRLWSVRNTGEGEASVAAQSVYSGHKRGVFSVSCLEAHGRVASCDGGLQLWDPFVCSTVQEWEAGRSGLTFTCVRSLAAPSPLLAAATSEGLVRLLDTRTQGAGADLRVSHGAAGLVRSLAASRSGGELAVGHSSGYISMLDLRTGRLRHGFKAHDGEVLTLTSISGQHFVSTSLDQTASGWRWEDSRLAANLRAPPEPVHCVVAHAEQEVIMGSTANRLTVQKAVDTEAAASVNKLRGDLLRGHLTSLACLPLNRLLLLGTDQGSVHLVC